MIVKFTLKARGVGLMNLVYNDDKSDPGYYLHYISESEDKVKYISNELAISIIKSNLAVSVGLEEVKDV